LEIVDILHTQKKKNRINFSRIFFFFGNREMKTRTIKSPASATIQWMANVNAIVEKGEPLAVLSAMKMEVKVVAKFRCKIASHVSRVNSLAKESQVLLKVEKLAESSDPSASASAVDVAWADRIERLRRRRASVRRMGGVQRLKRQRDAGKLNCRERVELFANKGTFREIGAVAGAVTHDLPFLSDASSPKSDDDFVGSNFVFGSAQIGASNRDVVLCVDDFTINASHSGRNAMMLAQKYLLADRVAAQLGLPVVRVLDGASGGGSVTAVLDKRSAYIPVVPGFRQALALLDVVPVVSVCAGPTVGLAAVKCAASHFRVFVDGIAQVLVAGPAVVEAVSGEPITKDELGGTDVVRRSGAVDAIASSEEAAAALVRRFVDFMPSSTRVRAAPIDAAPPALPASALDTLIDGSSRSTFCTRTLLDAIVDGSVEPLQFGATHGREAQCWMARIGGASVGIMIVGDARHNGGVLSAAAARKLGRFVSMCNTFALPLLSLVDMPGIEASRQAELANTLDPCVALAKILFCELRVPYASVIMRRCFGVGGAMFIDVPNVARVAWPSADWGSLPTAGGRRAMKQADDSGIDFAELTSPVRTAEVFGVEDIIRPSQTVQFVRHWLRLAQQPSSSYCTIQSKL
jgi:acetyl-CoA carboxylase carboxyltransferase component